MRDQPIHYAQSVHEAFARMHPLAQTIAEEALPLREQAVERFLGRDGFSHGVQGLEQIAELDSQVWRLQLVLMWDYLPSCREAVLGQCRAILAEAMGRLQAWVLHPETIRIEWVRRTFRETLPKYVKEIGEAHVLLGKEDLSDSSFAKGLEALTSVAMFTLSTDELEAWQTEIQLYQRLYAPFVAELSHEGHRLPS